MTPRQRDVVWALGIILVMVSMFVILLGHEDIWTFLAVCVIASSFSYIGGRTLLDKKYRHRMHRERQERAMRNNLEYVNEPLEAQDEFWAFGSRYWAARI